MLYIDTVPAIELLHRILDVQEKSKKVDDKLLKLEELVEENALESELDAILEEEFPNGADFSELMEFFDADIDEVYEKISAKNVGVVTLPYAFELSTLRGNPAHGDDIKFKDDFFTIIPKEADKIVPHYLKAGDAVTYNNVFEFKTADERTNFMNYLKTKAVRFILSLSKVDKNLLYGELNQIPWMDFTRSYSDKELCKMWNIDEKLWKFIDSHIPNYYPDYHFDGFYQDK